VVSYVQYFIYNEDVSQTASTMKGNSHNCCERPLLQCFIYLHHSQ